ncbi:MAG: ABC transporter [Anaerolineae bacterium]|nr:ABC transporter [Anaerolineae bacterium]
MKTLLLFRAFAPVDFKNIWRDAMLVWIPLLPLILTLALRFLAPPLADLLLRQFDLDLTPYYPLLMSMFVLLIPATVGMIVGFLLLDERDERTLLALMVTPMSNTSYLTYRIGVPLVIGFFITLITYPLAGLVPIAPLDLVIVSLLGAFTAPLIALFLAALSENKVAGLAMLKMLNGITILPIVSYFVPANWQWLAGIIPTYWSLKVFWSAVAGDGYWLYVLIGLMVNVIALVLLLRRWNTIMHR